MVPRPVSTTNGPSYIQGCEDYAAAYLDDLVIFSNSWKEHLEQLEVALSRIQKAGLTIKASKCQMGMEECVYLGHIVGNGVVRPEAGKLEAVKTFPIPKTKKHVRTFLGLTGYYRKFIPDYASISAPCQTSPESPLRTPYPGRKSATRGSTC